VIAATTAKTNHCGVAFDRVTALFARDLTGIEIGWELSQ